MHGRGVVGCDKRDPDLGVERGSHTGTTTSMEAQGCTMYYCSSRMCLFMFSLQIYNIRIINGVGGIFKNIGCVLVLARVRWKVERVTM